MATRFPFGSEFTPRQGELLAYLRAADDADGDQPRLRGRLAGEMFADTRGKNGRTRGNNAVLGMRDYGLLDDERRLTELGRSLLSESTEPERMRTTFGQHLLAALPGLRLVEAVRDMQAAGDDLKYETVIRELTRRGFVGPRGEPMKANSKHVPTMRLWLEYVGVFTGERWRIDDRRVQHLLDVGSDEIEAIASLTLDQRVFLRALASADPGGAIPSNRIGKLAEESYGVVLPSKLLPARVLRPLEEFGFIRLSRGEKTPGRGGRALLVEPTPIFEKAVVLPLIEQFSKAIVPEARALLRKPICEILEGLDDPATPTHVRGLSLEALAFRLLRIIDLRFVGYRMRGVETAGAEVDLMFDSSRLMYARWQVQCKNVKGGVRLGDVAKEVGLSHVLKSNVILIISTATIGTDARNYARKIMALTNLCIPLLDGRDLDVVAADPVALTEVLGREATNALKAKPLKGSGFLMGEDE